MKRSVLVVCCVLAILSLISSGEWAPMLIILLAVRDYEEKYLQKCHAFVFVNLWRLYIFLQCLEWSITFYLNKNRKSSVKKLICNSNQNQWALIDLNQHHLEKRPMKINFVKLRLNTARKHLLQEVNVPSVTLLCGPPP